MGKLSKVGKIHIEVGYDGSCPKSKKGVEKISEKFVIYPSFRDKELGSEEGKGMGFRLGFKVVNNGKKKEKVKIEINWENEKFMKYRDFIFLKHAEETEWKLVPLRVKGSFSILEHNFLRGETFVYLNPKYNYADYIKFIEKLKKRKNVDIEKAGETEEKRKIYLIKIGEGKNKTLIIGRNHAYESAGNFCIEGMFDYLMEENYFTGYFLKNFTFYFVPMTNPDGVFHGYSRLTPSGTDLNRIFTVRDKAWETLKNVIDTVKPHLFINIHNWMAKFIDGLLCLNRDFADRVVFYMPDQKKYGKKWFIEDRKEYFKRVKSKKVLKKDYSWKDYCEEKFGSIGMVVEFPWFGRNVSIMREQEKNF